MPNVFKERRQSPRLAFNRYARIQLEGSGSTRDCLIINMSEDGVRLHSEMADLPNEFTLVMADAHPQRRSCRVAWRLGFEFGAKFIDGDALALQRRTMPATAA
jgi:hypothetical protein